MDIMKIWTAYQKNANPETIFPMYQECELNAKAEGYGDVNLLHIASQNAHPEAIAWLLEQGLNPNEASRYGELPLFLLAKKGFSNNYIPRKEISTKQQKFFWMVEGMYCAGIPMECFAIIMLHNRGMMSFFVHWQSVTQG